MSGSVSPKRYLHVTVLIFAYHVSCFCWLTVIFRLEEYDPTRQLCLSQDMLQALLSWCTELARLVSNVYVFINVVDSSFRNFGHSQNTTFRPFHHLQSPQFRRVVSSQFLLPVYESDAREHLLQVMKVLTPKYLPEYVHIDLSGSPPTSGRVFVWASLMFDDYTCLQLTFCRLRMVTTNWKMR